MRDSEEGWVKANSDLLSPEVFWVYIAAYYWVIETFSTVGYGDIGGSTTGELIFTMMLYIIGIGFFGWMLGSLSMILNQVDSISEFK